MRVLFGREEGGNEFAAFSGAPHLRLHAAETVPEALKALGAPPLRNGRRVTRLGDFTVPEGARWIWARIANEGRDLTGEVTDVATIQRFAKYTVAQAGWVDLEHWSRPPRFPKEWLGQGVSPQDFILGKITDLRFDRSGDVYAETFLWPKGHNPHADRMWVRLCDCPESIHASVGGPPLAEREEEIGPDGRMRKRLRLLMNHFALCSQAVNPNGTEVSRSPFGPFAESLKAVDAAEFYKAVAYGVPSEPDCDGDTCLTCFVRGGEVHKAVTAGGAAGINTQGAVPQDIEGFRARALRNGSDRHPCKRHCGPDGCWRSDHDAVECLKGCHGLDPMVAAHLVAAGRKRKREDHAEAA